MLGVCYLYHYLVVGKGWEIRDSFWSRNPCQRRAHAFVDSRYHATRKNRIWVRSLYEAGCQRFLLSFFVSLLVPSRPGERVICFRAAGTMVSSSPLCKRSHLLPSAFPPELVETLDQRQPDRRLS